MIRVGPCDTTARTMGCRRLVSCVACRLGAWAGRTTPCSTRYKRPQYSIICCLCTVSSGLYFTYSPCLELVTTTSSSKRYRGLQTVASSKTHRNYDATRKSMQHHLSVRTSFDDAHDAQTPQCSQIRVGGDSTDCIFCKASSRRHWTKGGETEPYLRHCGRRRFLSVVPRHLSSAFQQCDTGKVFRRATVCSRESVHMKASMTYSTRVY